MIDVLIVFAFIVYSVASGFMSKDKASASLEEYFLAGKSIKGWRAGLSMAATQYAADTPLLVAGLICTGGIFMIWRLWIYGIAFLMMGILMSALWRRANVLTDAELTGIRYSGRGVMTLRIMKAVYYGTVINCTVMAMVLVAAARIAEIFLFWHEWLPAWIYQPVVNMIQATGLDLSSGTSALEPAVATANVLLSILVIVSFTTLYSTTGGLRSVIATDVVQFIFAMIATVAYAVAAVMAAGGLSTMLGKVQELYPQDAARMLSFSPMEQAGEVLVAFFVILSLQWFFQMNSDGTGYLAQRSMACSSDREARIAAIVFSFTQVLIRSLCWLPIVVALLVIYPFTPADMTMEGFAKARETFFAQGIQDLLPPGIKGLMLTGLLAALASTVDTHLNWGASYWSNDIYRGLICQTWQQREPEAKELVLVARLSNLLILGVALVIMCNLSSIQAAWQISLLLGAGMGSVLVLRWLWERINLWAEFAAMAVSLVLSPILLFGFALPEWQNLSIMAGVSTLVVVITTLVSPRTDREVLKAFFLKVHPAGFWTQAARDCGESPAEVRRLLFQRLLEIALCALTLFSWLYGFGKLLIHLPGESLMFPVLCIVLGASVVPIWWKMIFRAEEVQEKAFKRRTGQLVLEE